MTDFTLHQMCEENADERTWLRTLVLPPEAFGASAKFEWLRAKLPQMLSKGDRVLIFSQWTTLLDIMEVFLHTLSIAFLRIDGSTPVMDRQGLIDRFNAPGSPIGVFLLSTRAGGMGINLTSANCVIMHDIDWNPQNDQQAQDRCHRIGQKRHVRIVRLVVKDTVDEQILRIADRKRRLHQALLISDEGSPGLAGKSADGEGEEESNVYREIARSLAAATKTARTKGQ